VLRDGSVILFARNLDWDWGDGFVVGNKRGIEKTAFVLTSEKPARWTSKYGSVTFNQFGREMPYGGINETGLVVEQMMLMESKYPDADERPAINMLQWIQYQLDTCQTVAEVLATNDFLRHEAPVGKERIHYLICDAFGDTATIEFLNGEMVYHRGDALSARALANDTYRKSAEFRATYAASDSANSLPKGNGSLQRFARAAKCTVDFQSWSPTADREYAFHNLSDVAQGPYTVWSIVYDVSYRKVFYRTRENRKLRWFSLADFDYSPLATPVFLDINASGKGHISHDFRGLTDEQHQEYLFGFFGKSDVKEKLGDLMPLARALSATVQSYRPRVND
jgi:choloylglycine hydrolase